MCNKSPLDEGVEICMQNKADRNRQFIAAVYTPGMAMAGFIEEALAKSIEQLEEEKGEKFPQRERNLVGG